MLKRFSILISSLVIIAITFNSCYYDSKEDLYKNLANSTCKTDSVTYSGFVKNVMEQNCAISGCHVSPNPQNGIDLSNYQTVKTIADDGRLVNRINGIGGALMPPTGALSTCTVAKITAWVQNGAKND